MHSLLFIIWLKICLLIKAANKNYPLRWKNVLLARNKNIVG